MKKIAISAITLMFLSIVAVAFAETSLKAEVDKKAITADENITYKLTITSTEKNISKPQMPKFEGFNVVSEVQSSNTSLVRGSIKTILVYAFILTPIDIGKFKIEPSVIKIGNKTYSTDTFEIEVKPTLPKKPLSESDQPQITL